MTAVYLLFTYTDFNRESNIHINHIGIFNEINEAKQYLKTKFSEINEIEPTYIGPLGTDFDCDVGYSFRVGISKIIQLS